MFRRSYLIYVSASTYRGHKQNVRLPFRMYASKHIYTCYVFAKTRVSSAIVITSQVVSVDPKGKEPFVMQVQMQAVHVRAYLC